MEKLDSKPDETGYSVSENASALAFVELEGGPGRYCLDELDGARIVTLQWSGSRERYQYVRDFLNANVALNCPQFAMDLIIEDFNYREYLCNVIPDSISARTPKGIAWSISASFEVLPRDDEADTWPDDLCESDDNPPYITLQPLGGLYGQCVPIIFEVRATGSGPLLYQWFRNNVEIVGATSSSYTYEDTCDLANSGAKFKVRVRNDLGEVFSNEVQIALVQRYVEVHFIQAVDIAGGTGLQTLTGQSGSGAHCARYKDGVSVGNLSLTGSSTLNEFNFGYSGNGISCVGTLSAGHSRFWAVTAPTILCDEIRFSAFGALTTRSFRLEFLDADFNVIESLIIPSTGGLAASVPASLSLPLL